MNPSIAILFVLLLSSGILWCLMYWRRVHSLPTDESAPREPCRLSFPALALAAYLIATSLAGIWAASSTLTARTITTQALQNQVGERLLILALLLGALAIIPEVSLKDYGFRFRKLPQQLGVGGLAFLASVMPVYLMLWATHPLRSTETMHPLLQLLQSQPGGETVFWVAVTVMVIAPLSEELIYRVIVQTALERWLTIKIAWPLTALIFCAAHGWPDMLPLLPLALILGGVYYRYQSYLAVVVAHSLFNAWMLASVLLLPTSVP